MVIVSRVSQTAERREAIREFRWLILLGMLPLLFSETLGIPGANQISSLCGLGWMLGTGLLLWASDKPIRSNLWVWTIFFVFLMGFYVKYFAFAFGIGSPVFDLLMPELMWADTKDLNDALVWSTVGFLAFSLTAAVMLRISSVCALARAPRPELINQRAVYWILGATFVGVVGSLVAALIFGFGQMGLEHHELPLHLDAVFTRFRISLAPAIFVVALWITDHKLTRKVWAASLLTMIASAILDAYVRGSRGSIVLAFLPLIFLWCLSGTYTAGRKALTLAVVLLTVVLFPLFTGLRGERIASGQGIDYDQQTAAKQATSSEGIGLSLDQVAGRIVGIDSMIEIRHYMRTAPSPDVSVTTINPSRLAWLANGSAMVIFMTYSVVGIPEEIVEGRSPGFLGGLYLVGGTDGMVILTVLFVLLVALVCPRFSVIPRKGFTDWKTLSLHCWPY